VISVTGLDVSLGKMSDEIKLIAHALWDILETCVCMLFDF